jgi:hypothetical protein
MIGFFVAGEDSPPRFCSMKPLTLRAVFSLVKLDKKSNGIRGKKKDD